ncbi:MAG TPA: hypothetical protein VKF32_08470 [Thermoanaerobaculia bacterium]|nr:hypothetical protein [Thermoanaerobaculia bacterium]
MRRILEDLLALDGVERFPGFGCKVFALRYYEPAMRAFYDAAPVRGVLEQMFEDGARFPMTGVRWSTRESTPRLEWHDHYCWDPGLLRRRERFERLSFLCYIDGCDAAMGPLIASPRAFHDPLHAPSPDVYAARPEEVEIYAPPSSIVLMDSAVYHCARRGESDAMRTVWGGQAQAAHCRRYHPQTTDGLVPYLRAQRKRWRMRVRDQPFSATP